MTVPHFDLRTQEIANLTGAEMLVFVPLVEQSNRVGFVEYADGKQDWIAEDYVSFAGLHFLFEIPYAHV